MNRCAQADGSRCARARPCHRRPTRTRFSTRIREKLKEMGLDDLKTEAIVRDGDKAEEILKVINADEGYRDPGARRVPPVRPGRDHWSRRLPQAAEAGMFPIPVYLVPGTLTLDEVAALA